MATTDDLTNVVDRVNGRTGTVYTVAGTDPAAGAEISYTVPEGMTLKLKSVRIALVNAVVVVNRVVALQIKDDAGVVVWEISSDVNQGTGATITYSFIAGLGYTKTAVATAGQLAIGLPDEIILPAGWTVATSTGNLQGTDNYGAPVIHGIKYA